MSDFNLGGAEFGRAAVHVGDSHVTIDLFEADCKLSDISKEADGDTGKVVAGMHEYLVSKGLPRTELTMGHAWLFLVRLQAYMAEVLKKNPWPESASSPSSTASTPSP